MLPSIILSFTMACVGQASIHFLQLPQWSVVAPSSSNSKSQMISAKKKNEPCFLVIRLAFFPTQPIPDFLAHARSKTGAESVKTLNPKSPNMPMARTTTM